MSNDYQNLYKKHISVIYDCGYKCKKLHCEFLEYYAKNSKEKFIILKTSNNLIYHINCDKIVYLIADYEDIFPENEENIDFSSANSSIENEAEAFNEKTTYHELEENILIPSESENNYDSSLGPIETPSSIKNEAEAFNEKTTYDELEETILIPSESENNYDSSLEPIETPIIISDEHTIHYIMTDMEINHEKSLPDYKEAYDYNQTINQYKNKDTFKKNYLSSALSTFINCNFQGVNLTICTTSSGAISGEVIFNYDFLIIIKSDEKTYYINPEQIAYFY